MNRHRALLACLLMAFAAPPLLATWEDGVTAFRAGRYQDAASVFQSFVARSPEAPEGHYMLGLSLLRQNKPADAVGPLGKALALGEDDVRYRLTFAQALLKSGKPGDAFDVLAAQDPAAVAAASRGSFNQLLAKAATSCGRDRDGFAGLEKALAADRSSKTLWLARANLAGRLDRPREAFSALAAAFEIDPSDPEPGRSAAHAALAIAQDPATGERKLEWYVKADGVARAVARAFPTPENLRLAASTSMGAREYEAALGYLQRLQATAAEDPVLHYDLGRCRQALGQHREALGHFATALERSPDARLSADVHAQTGKALRVLEDFPGAAAAFRRAGDVEAAEEMEHYAQNRREWAKAKAECVTKRDGLEKLLADSAGLERTPEYKRAERDLAIILGACEPYFVDAG